MSIQLSLTCPLPNGIHARPASQIAAFCAQFNAEIRWRNHRNGNLADAKSVLGLISADILLNDLIDITLSGADEDSAASALKQFLHGQLTSLDAPLQSAPACRALPRSLAQLAPSPLFGQPVGQGVMMGKLVLYHTQSLPEIDHLPASRGETQEAQMLVSAQQQLELQLNQASQSGHGDAVSVARAHLAIIRDPDFKAQLEEALAAGCSAAQAIICAVQHYRAILGQSASNYLRERELDIRDVGQQLLSFILPETQGSKLTLPEQAILWAEDLTPSEFLSLDQQRLKGLLLARGGTTSHTVILARAFGMPILTGISASLVKQASGLPCVVDASLGALFIEPKTEVQHYYQEEVALQASRRLRQETHSQTGASLPQAFTLEFGVNISTAAEAQLGFANGADGVGLFRTEMLFMDRDTLPSEEEQFQAYAEVIKVANGRPVIIRTFDIGGDKPAACLPCPAENNPFLGYRAIRMYPDQEAAFRSQLRAIIRAAAIGPVKIMIPMISTLPEVRWVRTLLNEEHAALGSSAHIPLGIMLEVPSVLFQLDEFCQELEFFSVGSNDLTQYLFAADRDNSKVSNLYDSLHPAFLRALKLACDTVHRHHRWIGLCGEFAAAPLALPLLAALGFDELSMGAPSLLESRQRLRELDAEACQKLLDEAMRCEDGKAVRVLMQNALMHAEKSMLDIECIVLDAPWDSKAAAIKGLVDRLWLSSRCNDRLGMEEDLWLREEAYSTGLGYGFAIPHAKSVHIQHPTLCVAKLQQPVEWGASDGVAVDIVLMLAFNAKQAGSAHLKFFSRLARLIMHEEFRQRLRLLDDSQAILDFLSKQVDMSGEAQA